MIRLKMFTTSAFGGASVLAVFDLSQGSWQMAAIAFVVAAMVGALSQIERNAQEENETDKTICFCGSLFSGLAGFVVYAYSREHIQDPLKVLTVVIFAGICGAPLLRASADQFKKRFLGDQDVE